VLEWGLPVGGVVGVTELWHFVVKRSVPLTPLLVIWVLGIAILGFMMGGLLFGYLMWLITRFIARVRE
jgi:hypothetical protein